MGRRGKRGEGPGRRTKARKRDIFQKPRVTGSMGWETGREWKESGGGERTGGKLTLGSSQG